MSDRLTKLASFFEAHGHEDAPVVREAIEHIASLEAQLVEAQRERENWHDTARQMSNDMEFWRGLLLRCGEVFGVEARTADDGSVMESIVALKVPELVEAQAASVRRETLQQAADHVLSCREGGQMSGVVQVFDVLAKQIRELPDQPTPAPGEERR